MFAVEVFDKEDKLVKSSYSVKILCKIVHLFCPLASRAPFNWLTQSSLDTYTDYSSVGTETSSSLMFSVGTADMAARIAIHRPSNKSRSGFGQQRTGAKGKKQEKANGEVYGLC